MFKGNYLRYIDKLHIKYKVHDTYINFRCPICGDSQRRQHVARGYILNLNTDNPYYHCHNCLLHVSFGKFLKAVDYNVYREFIKDLKNIKIDELKKEKNIINVNITVINDEPEEEIDEPKSLEITGLKSIDRLSYSSVAAKYLIKREIPEKHWSNLYWFEGNPYLYFDRLFSKKKYASKYGTYYQKKGILIPFYNKLNKLYGFSVRDVNPNAQLRFVNLKCDDIEHDFFGVERVSYKKPIYIVEGLFDKLSFENDRQILAMMSMNTNMSSFPTDAKKSNIIYVFDNEYENPALVKAAKKIIKEGFSVMLWDKGMRNKDVNDLKQNGWSDTDLFDYFSKNVYTGFGAILHLDLLRISRLNYTMYCC